MQPITDSLRRYFSWRSPPRKRSAILKTLVFEFLTLPTVESKAWILKCYCRDDWQGGSTVIVRSRKTLKEFRGPGHCEWCHRWTEYRHAAHVRPRQMGGGSRLDVRINLCSLCPACHWENHNLGEPTQNDLKAVVAARECRLQDDIEAEIAALRKRRRQ